ncbi:unnamed protein product [Staurois parvus]|uniref:Uncharacterized protein n=1 Tax=Staurois parvus TaxID=386267 RepID=A0ABN9BH87_9NEOB|nr:unnamed protein product [Staurois parvus]
MKMFDHSSRSTFVRSGTDVGRETHSMMPSTHCCANLKATTVVPSCFHFVINPLTADRGIFSSKEISQMDLLHRWQPITVPCLNSMSSSEQSILSQMIVEAICMPRCLILYTRGHRGDWNT